MGPRWVPAALPHHHLLALPGASDPAGCFLLFLLLFFLFWRWTLKCLTPEFASWVCVCVLPVSVLANALHIFKNNTKTNKIRCNQWPCFTKLTGHFCFASFFFFLFPQRFSVLQFNFKCIYKIFPKCNWSKYFEGMRAMLENPSFSNPNTVLYGLWE